MPETPRHPGFTFGDAYAGPERPPWDIGRAQPALVELADEGLVRAPVLEVGCGTGENALALAARGLTVVGVDAVEGAIAEARGKAEERGLTSVARFEVRDIMADAAVGGTFGTVIDSGFFHALDDAGRTRFALALRGLLEPEGRYLMLCFSDRVPGAFGPRRVSQAEIRATFGEGWVVEEIRDAVLETSVERMPHVPAWLAVIRREA